MIKEETANLGMTRVIAVMLPVQKYTISKHGT